MGQHDVLGDGEAEAGASGFAGAGFVDAIEALEQAREVLGGNAGAEVLDEEFHGVGNGAGPEDDSSAGSAVLQRVVDQVGKDLVDGFAVGEDRRKILGSGLRLGKFLLCEWWACESCICSSMP